MGNDRLIKKNEHIDSFKKTFNKKENQDFIDFKLVRPSLPEIKMDEINLSTKIFGKQLSYPLYINAMTGGTSKSYEINDALSRLANKYNIGFALGSAAVLNEKNADKNSFKVARKNIKKGLVLANTNPNASLKDLNHIIDVCEPDALQIHLNPIQEIISREDDKDFKWIEKLSSFKKQIKIPLIVKETGFGFDYKSLRMLENAGIEYVDVSGTSGTNFVKIEEMRKNQYSENYLEDIGFSTIKSLLNGKNTKLNLFASGGIVSPLDAFKCLVLGAKLVGFSGIILDEYLKNGEKGVDKFIGEFFKGLINVFAIYGIRRVNDCKNVEYYLTGDLFKYAFQILRDK